MSAARENHQDKIKDLRHAEATEARAASKRSQAKNTADVAPQLPLAEPADKRTGFSGRFPSWRSNGEPFDNGAPAKDFGPDVYVYNGEIERRPRAALDTPQVPTFERDPEIDRKADALEAAKKARADVWHSRVTNEDANGQSASSPERLGAPVEGFNCQVPDDRHPKPCNPAKHTTSTP